MRYVDVVTKPFALPEPAPLPESGTYRGKPINLRHALATLTADELADVVVGGRRPWRFALRSDDVKVEGGAIVIG